jgi:hypothetical protein
VARVRATRGADIPVATEPDLVLEETHAEEVRTADPVAPYYQIQVESERMDASPATVKLAGAQTNRLLPSLHAQTDEPDPG